MFKKRFKVCNLWQFCLVAKNQLCSLLRNTTDSLHGTNSAVMLRMRVVEDTDSFYYQNTLY